MCCTFAVLKVWTRYGGHDEVYNAFKDLMKLEPPTDLYDAVDTETVVYSLPDAIETLNALHLLATKLSEYNWTLEWSDKILKRGQQ